MRISGNVDASTMAISKAVSSSAPAAEKGSDATPKNIAPTIELNQQLGNDDQMKIQEAVDKMNQMLEVNNISTKFMYHDGLERYYVTVVNRDTEEVVKEIPPKELLDAFYEMQKLLGMIVDEKI